MDNIKWAEREVRLACKKENPNLKNGEWDYGCVCYNSALKAYKALMESIEEDGHSGFSWSVTQNIISRLMQFKPLTPIEDTEDIWDGICHKSDDYTSYQCGRYTSFFKKVYKDGRVEYTDTNRAVCYDLREENPVAYSCAYLNHEVLDKMFPISMPYMPLSKPYRMYVEEMKLSNNSNSDYDTQIVRYIETPDNKRICINRYFTEKDNKMIEITEEEFEELKKDAEIS